jgi:hypothetical protein
MKSAVSAKDQVDDDHVEIVEVVFEESVYAFEDGCSVKVVSEAIRNAECVIGGAISRT